MKIRHIILFLIISITVNISICFAFADNEGDNPFLRAEQLNKLGLLKGVSKGNYDMMRAPTRTESVVMVIRLLGKENEAQEYNASENPFYDVPAWAVKYIAYAYDNGLVKGISNRQFGAHMATSPEQYITFLLRALYYSDDHDFSYDDSIGFASSIGLLDGWNDSGFFSRSDMIILSFNALNAGLNNGEGTLADSLLEGGVFTDSQLNSSFGLSEILIVQRNDFEWEDIVAISIESKDSFLNEFKSALKTMPDEVLIYIKPGTENEYFNYLNKVCNSMIGYAREYEVSFISRSGMISVKPSYSKGFQSMLYIQNPTIPVSVEIKSLAMSGFNIYRDEFADKNSDYGLTKAIHDYIVTELEYDLKDRPGSEDLDGAIYNKTATCGGYSAMFQFFAGIGGLEVEMVFGTSTNQVGMTENHAWNIVKLDGNWYNIDVTWNDPVTFSADKNISYKYFLISDYELSKDHIWDKSHYPSSPFSWH